MFAYAFVGRDSTGRSLDDYLYRAQSDIIRKLAEEAPRVIVGRCADYILRDRKWGSVKNYTLTVNSSEVDYERCIELIAGLLDS